MSKFLFLAPARTPANGVPRRPVPNHMAPERCVTRREGTAPKYVQLVARDLSGTVRMTVEVHEDDVGPWLLKVIRHWLAWAYGASEIKIVS